MRQSPFLSFVVISAIWGTTWIAIKIGVDEAPPLFFAATRFFTAGVLLLFLFRKRVDWLMLRRHAGKVTIVALLISTLCYGPLFWGMQFTPTGLAAIVNLSLIPLSLFGIGLALGEEQISFQNGAGLVLGIIGLVILFLPELDMGEMSRASGVIAIALGTISYALGSILSRKWLNNHDPIGVSGAVMVIGGIGIGVMSLMFETVTKADLALFARPEILASWLYLVFAASMIAFTLYLQLLKDWGPGRAGLYAFVSPFIALITGAVVLGEQLNGVQLLGGLVMMLGAFVASRPKPTQPWRMFIAKPCCGVTLI